MLTLFPFDFLLMSSQVYLLFYVKESITCEYGYYTLSNTNFSTIKDYEISYFRVKLFPYYHLLHNYFFQLSCLYEKRQENRWHHQAYDAKYV